MESLFGILLLFAGGNAINGNVTAALAQVMPWYSPNAVEYIMQEFCGESISLQTSGRSSGGILKLSQDVKMPSSDTPCFVSLPPPKDFQILVAFKDVNIWNIQESTEPQNYVQVLGGNTSKEEILSEKIHGKPSKFQKESHIYTSNPGIPLKISAFQANISEGTRWFNFILSFTAFNKSDDGRCLGLESFCCKNKHCIWIYLRCDGYNNCGDGSDETGCTSGIQKENNIDTGSATTVPIFVFLGAVIVITCIIIFMHVNHALRRLNENVQSPVSSSFDSLPTLTSNCQLPNEPAFSNGGFLDDVSPPSYEEVMAYEANHRSRGLSRQTSSLQTSSVFP